MSPLVTPASSATTPVHPVKTSTLVSPVMLRNPGVSLVGRSVSKAFVDSESATGYAYCTGKVLGCREQDAFGLVYVVEFPDGDQDEMIYEELMLVLVEDELQTGRVGATMHSTLPPCLPAHHTHTHNNRALQVWLCVKRGVCVTSYLVTCALIPSYPSCRREQSWPSCCWPLYHTTPRVMWP